MSHWQGTAVPVFLNEPLLYDLVDLAADGFSGKPRHIGDRQSRNAAACFVWRHGEVAGVLGDGGIEQQWTQSRLR